MIIDPKNIRTRKFLNVVPYMNIGGKFFANVMQIIGAAPAVIENVAPVAPSESQPP